MSGNPSCDPVPFKMSTKELAAAHSRYFSPEWINTNTFPKFYEEKFNSIIPALGTFKIKMKESSLLMYYFKIKLQCKTDRYQYDTIVIGDQYDEEADARENVFSKAIKIVNKIFVTEMTAIRNKQSKGLPTTNS